MWMKLAIVNSEQPKGSRDGKGRERPNAQRYAVNIALTVGERKNPKESADSNEDSSKQVSKVHVMKPVSPRFDTRQTPAGR